MGYGLEWDQANPMGDMEHVVKRHQEEQKSKLTENMCSLIEKYTMTDALAEKLKPLVPQWQGRGENDGVWWMPFAYLMLGVLIDREGELAAAEVKMRGMGLDTSRFSIQIALDLSPLGKDDIAGWMKEIAL